jgi:putative transferase (TIGR04331 family)
MNNFLITTADEQTWRFDCPVVFLGPWCLLYDRKFVWTNLNSQMLELNTWSPERTPKEIRYIQNVSMKLMIELTTSLNNYHKENKSYRYWNILLGHWVKRFTGIIYERYHTVKKVLELFKISETAVYKSDAYHLATYDSGSLVWACNDNYWNNVLYGKIIEHIGGVKITVIPHNFNWNSRSRKYVNSSTFPRSAHSFEVKHVPSRFVTAAYSYLTRNTDAVLINTYLPKFQQIQIQLALGQFPRAWRTPVLKKTHKANGSRDTLNIDIIGYTDFELFLRSQIVNFIPICYLEGYDNLLDQVRCLSWPTKPKFIFACNGFDSDEIFKVWTALRAEGGVPYYVGQHGANYGTFVGCDNFPERESCDRFLTWGWSSDNGKDVPAFMFREKLKIREGCRLFAKKLLLIETVANAPRLGPESVNSLYADYEKYQNDQFKFVTELPEAIRPHLIVRLHSEHKLHDWADEQRWRDFDSDICINMGFSAIRSLISQSRLIVHSYDSTGILETLAANIPTVCFWSFGVDHVLPSAKPYYLLLMRAGILFDNPEKAANHVELHWTDLERWWSSDDVQNARLQFCKRYAKIESRPTKTLMHLLS